MWRAQHFIACGYYIVRHGRQQVLPKAFPYACGKMAILADFHFRDKWKSGAFPILPFPLKDGNQQG